MATYPIPYIGYSNENLDKQPKIKAGDSITHEECGKEHKLVSVGEMLAYLCHGQAHLAAVKGRSVMRAKPDVSGEVNG